ncbi:hypothetical protein [Metallosphaera hakonensis]|uniref:Uncharacterized protein n=1 Tax=Metallosphaera hakonensis JCM 8857 = DSM 7519 TaxID=1293036 RepID=A0A2U9IVY1_9CREN|nr:hypothetical protein [Metallosphaera hakonensis]AWS00038.1 hypothetical protein DFR87_10495 [Metallosphaera hakonensis JCM 8857 = DSM 7519]
MVYNVMSHWIPISSELVGNFTLPNGTTGFTVYPYSEGLSFEGIVIYLVTFLVMLTVEVLYSFPSIRFRFAIRLLKILKRI